MLHLLKFGLLGAIYKIYYTPLIHFAGTCHAPPSLPYSPPSLTLLPSLVLSPQSIPALLKSISARPTLVSPAGHTVLQRKGITASVKHYFSCDALYFRIADALTALMFEAHAASSTFLDNYTGITSLELYMKNFLVWYAANLRTGDVPLVFYSSFVFGVGMLYRAAKQAISARDNLQCFALLLPAMGLFKITAKHNLTFNAFLSLAKLLSSTEEVAKALLANVTASRSGRPFSGIAMDELLETLQGIVKGKGGKKWCPTTAKIHTALNFVLNRVRANMENATKGKDAADATPKGTHVAAGHADTFKVMEGLRKVYPDGGSLFVVPRDAPRTSLPTGLSHNGFTPPSQYVRAEVGGLINFTEPLSATSPLFVAASAAAKELLQRCGAAVDAEAPA